MLNEHKIVVEKINAACVEGDTEAFLSFFSDDVTWEIIGEKKLVGKEAIRQFMGSMPTDLPKLTVDMIIAEGDIAVCRGNTQMKGDDGLPHPHAYCDIYQFNNDKVSRMTTFVKQTSA